MSNEEKTKPYSNRNAIKKLPATTCGVQTKATIKRPRQESTSEWIAINEKSVVTSASARATIKQPQQEYELSAIDDRSLATLTNSQARVSIQQLQQESTLELSAADEMTATSVLTKDPVKLLERSAVEGSPRHDSDDEDKLFLLSLVSPAKSVPDRLKLQMRLEMMQVVMKYNQSS